MLICSDYGWSILISNLYFINLISQDPCVSVWQWRSHWIWLSSVMSFLAPWLLHFVLCHKRHKKTSQFENLTCVWDVFFPYLETCFCQEMKFDQIGFLGRCFGGLLQEFHHKNTSFIRFHEEWRWWQMSTRPIRGLHFRSDQSKWSAAGKSFRPLTLHLLAVLFHFWSFHHRWRERRMGWFLSPQETNEGFCVGVATLCGVKGHACPPPYHIEHILCLLALNVLCCDCARPPW